MCVALSPVRCPKGVREGSNDNKGEQTVDTKTPIAEERLVGSERYASAYASAYATAPFKGKQFFGGPLLSPSKRLEGWKLALLNEPVLLFGWLVARSIGAGKINSEIRQSTPITPRRNR